MVPYSGSISKSIASIDEGAYRGMIRNIKDQAILITGESGVGRTGNTKGVITYSIAAASSKKSGRKVFPRTRLWPLILLMPTATATSPRARPPSPPSMTMKGASIHLMPSMSLDSLRMELGAVFKITTSVMSCGEVVYVTKGRDDQYQGRRYFMEGCLSGVSLLWP